MSSRLIDIDIDIDIDNDNEIAVHLVPVADVQTFRRLENILLYFSSVSGRLGLGQISKCLSPPAVY